MADSSIVELNRACPLFGEKPMAYRDRLKDIEAELKKSSKELFKRRPKEIEDELAKKNTFGSPDNLIDRGDQGEPAGD